ncbi:MAG: hypothetical protein CBC09_03945 [Cellvibrionales bacterium TMED49]|nr:QacE family quaternary ammonium compound efflux SMR transporter [Porticoccaceae bacterium]OUU38971.1 MAG: hypothetical protein CBC09_03945 [Cellvibrionales bacterium TMED49]
MAYLSLFIAIIAEVFATSMLKASAEFTKIIPSVFALSGYTCSLYFLTLVLRDIPLGIAYAIWSGAGIALISVVGVVVYKQDLDYPAVVGIILIISGCVIINLFSHSTHTEIQSERKRWKTSSKLSDSQGHSISHTESKSKRGNR